MAKKTKNPANEEAKKIANNVYGKLNELHIEAKNWEHEHYNPTMDLLYGLLSKALVQYYTLDNACPKVRRAFTSVLERKKITCTARTSTQLRIVRVVFGIDTTQRANRYAKVIKIAAENKIAPETFADWVVENGGIDEIRRVGTKKEQPDFQAVAEDYYENNSEMPTTQLVDANFSENKDSDFRLLVVRQNADGTTSVISEVNNLPLINASLTFLGKEVVEKQKEADKQADEDARLDAAVEAGNDNVVEAEKVAA